MKKIFTLISLLFVIYSKAQVICGTAPEGGTVTLTAPVGNVITSIDFASYGTPDGTCGSFTLGSCHEVNSQSICEAVFLGQNSASIDANNTTFGDPCGGTFKRLYIQATYSSTLPLTLISFTAQKTEQGEVKLAWLSNDEVNTLHFVIERSTDGILFNATGKVSAAGSGTNKYSFTVNNVNTIPFYYYRLKMVDRDGKYRFSNIVRISNNIKVEKLSVFPNPATDYITVISSKKQAGFITNSSGQVIKNILLISGNQTINVTSWPTGTYFIKTGEEVVRFIKR